MQSPDGNFCLRSFIRSHVDLLDSYERHVSFVQNIEKHQFLQSRNSWNNLAITWLPFVIFLALVEKYQKGKGNRWNLGPSKRKRHIVLTFNGRPSYCIDEHKICFEKDCQAWIFSKM